MKVIKVSKISLESLNQLRAAGFHIEFEQVTLKPANPRHSYDLQPVINELTRAHKLGIEPKKIVKSNKALKGLSKKVSLYEKD